MSKEPEIDMISKQKEEKKDKKPHLNLMKTRNILYFEKTVNKNNKKRGESLNVSKPGIYRQN